MKIRELWRSPLNVRFALTLLIVFCFLPYGLSGLVLNNLHNRRAMVLHEVHRHRSTGEQRTTKSRILLADEAATVWDAGLSDQRMRAVKNFLPPRGLIGYVGNDELKIRMYYLAQYSLSPRVLICSSQPRLILAEFSSPARYRQAQQQRILEQWVEERNHKPIARWRGDNNLRRVVARRDALIMVRDFGNGLMLFRHPR